MSDPGKVVTFYSYKGGTGRTMALANVAVLLARRRRGRILMVDWDLEAPGLHEYFPDVGVESEWGEPGPRPGVLELLESAHDLVHDSDPGENGRAIWEALDVGLYAAPSEEDRLDLMTAGVFDDTYGERVCSFPWQEVFRMCPGLYASLSQSLAASYEYVLIDSRTGLSDSSGVSTMLMPDHLVTVFTPNRQSLDGAVELARRATAYRSESADLRPLIVYPLASRVETSEDELRRRWRHGGREVFGYQPVFERLFAEAYDLSECDLGEYFDEVQIQHVPRYAYGEQVAVRDPDADRLSVARSYEQLARALLDDEGPWTFRRETAKAVGLPEDERNLVLEHVERACERQLRLAHAAARRDRRIRLLELVLVLTVVVVTLTALLVRNPSESTLYAELLTLGVGTAAAAGAETYRRIFNWSHRAAVHRRTASALERELTYFRSRGGGYETASTPPALLAERTGEIERRSEDALLGALTISEIEAPRRGSGG